MCPHSYFLEYNLGLPTLSNMAADKGTIVHKVLEILALIKKAKQEKKTRIKHEICGNIQTDKYKLDIIIEQIYKYYSTHITHHTWTNDHFQECRKWVYKAIEYNDGQFNPLNRIVIDAEPFFDIEIAEPWAMYKYAIKDNLVKKFLSIKGTVDLVTQIGNGVYEIIDWKSGKYRKNWATGEDKNYEDFKKDPQLRIYHYAAHRMYKMDQVLVTVFYINAGGPYTVCFEKKDLKDTEEMLRIKFEEIKQDIKPKLNKSWKCTKFCHFGLNTFEGTHVNPKVDNSRYMTQCEQVEFDLFHQGMDCVIKKYTMPEYQIGNYRDPGSI